MKQTAIQDTAVGIGVLVLAAIVAWQTTLIPENAIYAKVGPKVFPWIAVTMLTLMGALLTLAGLRGGWEHDEGPIEDKVGLGWVLGGLALNVALIGSLGFILASMLLFVCVARGFGSMRPLFDALAGFLLAAISYVGFDRILGYKIGTGLVEQLIARLF